MKTYKHRFNEELGFDKDQEHTLQELKDITGIPMKILKEVDKRGKGAYGSNLGSVRLKDDYSKNTDLRKGASERLSAEQWRRARIYAFLYKTIFQKMRYKKQDTDLYEKVLKISIIFFLRSRHIYLIFTELELELIQTQMTQRPMLRAEVGMRVRCANKAITE